MIEPTVRSRLQLLVVMGVSAALAACGSSNSTTPSAPTPTPAPVNHAPVITNITVSPTFGVSGLTTITMSATATDADNDTLTYTWTYGGATATGATNSARLTGDGTVTVQLTVSDGRGGTATDSRSVTIGTMTGNWALVAGGCGANPGEQPAVMTLTQTGTAVNGTIYWPTTWCNMTPRTTGSLHDPGTIDDQGNFAALRISATSGTVGAFLDFQLTGRMDSTGRRITGVANQSGFNNDPMTMTKQ